MIRFPGRALHLSRVSTQVDAPEALVDVTRSTGGCHQQPLPLGMARHPGNTTKSGSQELVLSLLQDGVGCHSLSSPSCGLPLHAAGCLGLRHPNGIPPGGESCITPIQAGPNPDCECLNPGKSPTCGVVPSRLGISLTGPWRLTELEWRRLRHAEATMTHLPRGSTRRAFTT